MPHPLLTRLALAAGLLGAAARPAAAQAVRGTVEHPPNTPAPSDLTVALLDAAGRRLEPRLVPASGRFELRAPAAGSYQVALYRVGYVRVTSPTLRLADGETVPVRLAAPARRVQLAAVRATARAVCASEATAGSSLTLLWEEVRKALEANALAADGRTLDAVVLGYERERAVGGRGDGRVRRERVVTERLRVREPYHTRPAAELLAAGFVRAGAVTGTDTLEAYAPDARVLLDPRFLETHCLGVRTAGAPERGWVGLTFAPVRSRGVADVSGTLWVERATAELRTLEFSYAPLPGRWAQLGTGPLAVAGGEVTFARLPSGLWVVRGWRLRVPRPSARPVDPLAATPRYAVEGVWEVGGELVDARRVGEGAADSIGTGRVSELVAVAASVRVLGAGGRGLSAATVSVDSGEAVAADSAGVVALDALSVGGHLVRVRAPGHAPFDTTLAVPPVSDLVLALALDSVDATGARVDSAVTTLAGRADTARQQAARRRVAMVQASPLAGFERRRRSGLGVYLTRDQIMRRRPRRIEDVFLNVLGVRVDATGVRIMRPGFPGDPDRADDVACYPAVFLDGTRGPVGSPFGGTVAEDLHGVEIYRGVGTTPPEFAGSGNSVQGAGCGVIAVWTQRLAGLEATDVTDGSTAAPPGAPPNASPLSAPARSLAGRSRR